MAYIMPQNSDDSLNATIATIATGDDVGGRTDQAPCLINFGLKYPKSEKQISAI